MSYLFVCFMVTSERVYAKPVESIMVPGAATVALLPRTETLYFNGQQWGPVNCWNPYSSGCNNPMAIAQQDNARVTMFETPYLYNMLDGKLYPLLADGPWSWNAGMTEITFKLKSSAKWSDGTPVTANDIAYTYASHVKYNTDTGYTYKDYIASIDAVDPQTVRVRAKLKGDGKAINPLMVSAYLSNNYVIQKAWTQTVEARTGADADAFKSDAAEDVIASGPYMKYLVDNTQVVLIRNDNYWGKNASMWGKLPAPKYLAHIIYPDNDAGVAALKAGQVDVSQQFVATVQNLWLVDHLPISTYLPDAPYGIGASLPTAFYNLNSYGLDQIAIRKAIAIAVNYSSIIANAMSNQSATFTQVPRSLMNPTPAEQALYDHDAVKDLQWVGNDIQGAKKLLDDAGITDTDGDGWREYHGKKLSYVATCPNGWSDWQAAIEVLAATGQAIGIDITTNYPEWSDYQTAVTNWPLPDGYDIFMMWSDGAGPTQPWSRIRHLISSEYAGTTGNWNGNWGGYSNPAADALIRAIPGETNPATLKAYYTELTGIYLTDIPSFTLMYRPQSFHTLNESVWTGFSKSGDAANPPIPPLNLTDGYGIADLYNLTASPSKNTQILIPGTTGNTYYVLPHYSLRKRYPGLNNGPVTVQSLDTTPVIASQRVIFGGISYSEMMGLPKEQLSKEYWFPYYNNVAMNSQLRVSNMGGANTTINVYLGTNPTPIDSYTLVAGGATRKNYDGKNGGPLRVTSTVSNILTTIRVLYGGASYSEMMGLPADQLAKEYLYPFYNNVAMNSQLRVSNVGGANTTINVYLGSNPTPIDSYTLVAGGATRKNYDGKNGGPLRVTSTVSNILTTIRVLYASNSYSELMGFPANQVAKENWYPVYDNSALDSQLRVSNVGNGTTTIKVYARGSLIDSYALAAGVASRKNYPYNTGPLHIISSTQPILSTIRMLYLRPGYSSYYEMTGLPDSQLSTQYFFPWYNNTAMNSELRFAVP